MVIDLALQFDKKALLREPFNNYRFATQNTNMASFESVLLYFASAAEEKDKNVVALAKDKVIIIMIFLSCLYCQYQASRL